MCMLSSVKRSSRLVPMLLHARMKEHVLGDMARIEPRSASEGRRNLEQIGLLHEPLTMLIEPVSVCSLKCRFCPTGDFELSKNTKKHQGFIEERLFKKIIDEAALFKNRIAALHLHKDGEPLLHPKFCELVEYASNSNAFEKIETTTNGIALSSKMNKKLAGCGLTRIKISIYGLSDSDYLENCRTKVDFNKLVANIQNLYEEIKMIDKARRPALYIKTMSENISERYDDFYRIFDGICDSMYVENCVDNWPGYTFTDDNKILTQHTLDGFSYVERKKICPLPFLQLSITSDGWVLPCCADWQVANKIVNINDISIGEAWRDVAFRDFRAMMLRGERFDHPICGSCKYPDQTCVDNFDSTETATLLTELEATTEVTQSQ